MNLGERIKKLRIEAGYTQAQLAELADVWQSTIAELESGRRSHSANVFAIAAALGVSANWLQIGDGTPTSEFIQPKIARHEAKIEEIIKLMLSTDERGREKILLSAKDTLDSHRAFQASILPKSDKTAAIAAQLGQQIISKLIEKDHDFSDAFDHIKNEVHKHRRSQS